MAKRPVLAFGKKKVVEEAFKHGGSVAPRRLDRASGGRANATSSPLAASSSKNPWSSAKRG